MRTAKDFRDVEKAFRDVADAAAKCAELEESDNSSEAEKDEALKNFTWAVYKMKSM